MGFVGSLIDDQSQDPTSTANASAERARPSAPPEQLAFVQSYTDACASYDGQPNEIQKSKVFRDTMLLLEQQPRVRDWVGTLKTLRTNQGGSEADAVINIGRSDIYVDDVPAGTPVYDGLAAIREGQAVTFSVARLNDFNLTERGKVCDPDFRAVLTSIERQ